MSDYQPTGLRSANRAATQPAESPEGFVRPPINPRVPLSLALIVLGVAGVATFTSLAFGIFVGMIVLSVILLGLGILVGFMT